MFTYNNLLEEIDQFSAYGCETGVVGESFLGQRIPYLYIGNDKRNSIIVQGAIHGREHLTALMLICMAKHLLSNPTLALYGGIYFVPMVNPDGVRIAQEGVSWIANEDCRQFLLELNGNADFSLWKANGRGVDLNVNFDADWGTGEHNVFSAASENYVGEYAESECESHALAQFTRALSPLATLSYHSKGEVIYWRYGQTGDRLWRDYKLAKGLALQTGYQLISGGGSAGGYKDWCIKELGIPAFTVEVGSDDYAHPLPYEILPRLNDVHIDLPRRVVNTLSSAIGTFA